MSGTEIFFWYGILALTHLFLQINFAHAEYLNSARKGRKKTDIINNPSAAIIIPFYNEGYKELKSCISSALKQAYNGRLVVIALDDGSKDPVVSERIKEIFREEIGLGKLIVKRFEKNEGKRHVQKEAFDILGNTVDIIITIDSDTIMKKNATKYLMENFNDPEVGAMTGDVEVIKKKKLDILIAKRYWAAFNQERAAQSLFGTVLCCSGPLAAYRNTIIQKIKEKYINQFFLGTRCTYGDDRHLTNLVLTEGYKVKYDSRAKARTFVPPTIKLWIRQQQRWSQSFYRELLWTGKMIFNNPRKAHPYMIYDMSMQFILPFFLLGALVVVLYNAITISYLYALGYLAMVLGVAMLRGFYAFMRTGDKSFFLLTLYALLHVTLLIPVRLTAIISLKSTTWGTR